MNYAHSPNADEFGNCPTCNKPFSKNLDKQLAWISNAVCVFVVCMALVFIWVARITWLNKHNPITATGTPATSRDVNLVVPAIGLGLPRPAAHNTRGLTSEQFRKLKVGMSYKQVSHVLGSTGTLTGQTRSGGNVSSLYHWQNPDGSNISVELRHDKLALKASFALKPAVKSSTRH